MTNQEFCLEKIHYDAYWNNTTTVSRAVWQWLTAGPLIYRCIYTSLTCGTFGARGPLRSQEGISDLWFGTLNGDNETLWLTCVTGLSSGVNQVILDRSRSRIQKYKMWQRILLIWTDLFTWRLSDNRIYIALTGDATLVRQRIKLASHS